MGFKSFLHSRDFLQPSSLIHLCRAGGAVAQDTAEPWDTRARAGAQEAACWPAEHLPAGEHLRVPCTLETAEQTTDTREEALSSPSLAVPPAPSVNKV